MARGGNRTYEPLLKTELVAAAVVEIINKKSYFFYQTAIKIT